MVTIQTAQIRRQGEGLVYYIELFDEETGMVVIQTIPIVSSDEPTEAPLFQKLIEQY